MMQCLHFCRGRCILHDAVLAFLQGEVLLRSALFAFCKRGCICMVQYLHVARGVHLHDAVLAFLQGKMHFA